MQQSLSKSKVDNKTSVNKPLEGRIVHDTEFNGS